MRRGTTGSPGCGEGQSTAERSPGCGEGRGTAGSPQPAPLALFPANKTPPAPAPCDGAASLALAAHPSSFNTLTNHPSDKFPNRGSRIWGTAPHIPSLLRHPHTPTLGRTGHCWWAEPPSTRTDGSGQGQAGPHQPRAAARLPNKDTIQCRWRGAQGRFRCRPVPRSSSQEKGAEQPPRDANGQRTKGASGRRSGTMPSTGSNLRPRDGPRSG